MLAAVIAALGMICGVLYSGVIFLALAEKSYDLSEEEWDALTVWGAIKMLKWHCLVLCVGVAVWVAAVGAVA